MREKEDGVLSGVKEIARRANVSLGTVDRVLNNRAGVALKTKIRVKQVIEELNYQPNVLARRLAMSSRSSLRVAVLLPGISDETEYWKAPLEGITRAEEEIKQYGVLITHYFFDQNDAVAFAKQAAAIMKSQPDGVLITPTFEKQSVVLLEDCKKRKIPCVLMNSDIPGQTRLSYIGPELFHSGYLSAQLVNYCLRPEQKVLLVNIAREIESNAAILHKEEGFLAYFREKLSEQLLVRLNSKETSYEAVSLRLKQVFEKEPEIGIIYVTNSRVSLVAHWLEANGKTDVILLGYDYLDKNLEFLERGVIDFLICERPQEQGYRSIMSLFQHLVRSAPVEESYLIPIDIVTRANYRYYRN